MIRFFLFAGTLGSVLALDLWTKTVAQTVWAFTPWRPVAWFSLTYSENTGIAFGLPFGGTPLLILTLLMMTGVAWFAHRQLDLRRPSVTMLLAFALGGALGNFYDRLMYGAVRDFIAIGAWPTFNLADSALVVSLTCLAFISYRSSHD